MKLGTRQVERARDRARRGVRNDARVETPPTRARARFRNLTRRLLLLYNIILHYNLIINRYLLNTALIYS